MGSCGSLFPRSGFLLGMTFSRFAPYVLVSPLGSGFKLTAPTIYGKMSVATGIGKWRLTINEEEKGSDKYRV